MQIFSAILACAVTAVAAGELLDSPIDGYPIVDVFWTAKVTKDGPEMNFTGSAQEVRAQVLKLNPNYDDDFADVPLPPIAGSEDGETGSSSSSNLDKRFGPVCGGGCCDWKPAPESSIRWNRDYLWGLAQFKPSMNQRGCARVSCEWNTGIWWCNDNAGYIELPGFNTIGDCAEVTRTTCMYYSYGYGQYVAVGQNFNGGNWNCVVREDLDHC